MARSAHSTDRELIKRSSRTLELCIIDRDVVFDFSDRVSVFVRRLANDEGQFDAVHLSIVLEIGFNRNLATAYTLGDGICSDEQPRLSIEVPFFGATFGRRCLYAICRMVGDLRLAYESHFWIKLLELDIPVKLVVAFFRSQFSSAQFTKPTISRIKRPTYRPIEPTRDFKFDAITQYYLADSNAFVRSLLIYLKTGIGAAAFNLKRHLRDAARQLTESRRATDGLNIPVEDLIHGRR